LWVFDEVQLMGSALATTAQLDAFAKKLWRPVKSKRFLWMSATVESSILETQDRKDWGVPSAEPWELEEEDRVQLRTRLQAPKTLQLVNKRPTAEKILKTHPRGRLSLVMLNTVPVAKKVYGEIGQEIARTAAKTNSKVCRPTVCLLHSRFRPMERDSRMESLLAFLKEMDESGAVPDSDGLIVVSTQVVEAGVDMSAARLWSEVAPWPSMIQRLGRLNREGAQPDACASFWMPMADDTNKGDESPNAKRVGPYEKGALNCARTLLEEVIGRQADSSSYRDALDAVLLTEESREAMQVKPELVIRPDDFFELFSTEPDLAGGFTNVAQFVRDQDRNVDVRVFWREFDPAKIAQPNESAPLREELCSVPFFEFRQFVGKGHAVWEWNFEMGKWESRRASEIQPGMTLLLPKSAGGYQPDVGWTGDSKHRDFCVLPGSDDDDSLDTDFLSGAQEWISLSGHLADVEHEMHEILEGVGLEETPFAKALMAAAHRHDWGKSLDNWQDAVKVYAKNAYAKLEEFVQSAAPPGFDAVASEWQDRLRSESAIGQPWAKFPDIRAASLDSRLKLSDPERAILAHDLKVQFRPMLRHEAASALAAWQSWLAGSDELTALAVYLVACHHGKVRAVLRSTHASDDVFGLTDDMVLQPIPGCSPTRVTLRMDAKYVGASGEWDEKGDSFMITSPSWLQMVAELLGPKRESDPVMAEVVPGNEPHDLGPLTLAYLESLLRAADARASRLPGKGAKL
jgi:CRISPR-associated endonuclease/helicase Cas3